MKFNKLPTDKNRDDFIVPRLITGNSRSSTILSARILPKGAYIILHIIILCILYYFIIFSLKSEYFTNNVRNFDENSSVSFRYIFNIYIIITV